MFLLVLVGGSKCAGQRKHGLRIDGQVKLVAQSEGSACSSDPGFHVGVAFLVVQWMARAPGLYERSIQYGINVFCIVPFLELNNFFLDYSCEVVFPDFADEPAENGSWVTLLVFFDETQFSKPCIDIEKPGHFS